MRTFIVFILVFNSLFALAQPQIIFQDTLGSQPVGWKLRNSTPHDWRWYNNVGVGNGGGLRMKLPNDSNYVATSAVNLVAGQTYTLSFKARMDEGSTSRLVSVGYNEQQSWGGTSFIFSAQLPTDSYNTPPFTEYNPTFTVPQDGVYFFIFNFTQNGYAFTYMDEIVIERTIFPQTTITFPAQNASYNEGTDLTLTASASDSDGSVAKVEFFANGVKLGEDLTAPYEYQWINILPKDYQLITKATDNRGNVTTSEIVNVRMNFRDGSFGKYVHWDFDKSTNNQFDYWTLKNGDFKTRTGWRNTPCFEIFSAYSNNFAASPGVYLRAGETYKLELLSDCSGTKNPRFYVNTSQELGGMLIDTIRITSNDNFNLVKTKTFSVSANGTYYLIINY
nr:Ig-like domain-containing protein [Spirosomataceae bacterium]